MGFDFKAATDKAEAKLTETIDESVGEALLPLGHALDPATSDLTPSERKHLARELGRQVPLMIAYIRTNQGRDDLAQNKPLMLGSGSGSDDTSDTSVPEMAVLQALATQLELSLHDFTELLKTFFAALPDRKDPQFAARAAAMTKIANGSIRVDNSGKLEIATQKDALTEQLRLSNEKVDKLEKAAKPAPSASSADITNARKSERDKVILEIAPAITVAGKLSKSTHHFDPAEIKEAATRDALMTEVAKNK